MCFLGQPNCLIGDFGHEDRHSRKVVKIRIDVFFEHCQTCPPMLTLDVGFSDIP